ncbi:hypothetical protein K438DRAFT_1834040 [Mycena galopus ATCC 62051]|nr:hypothetical protein K438DRAFT_1834040 [Mycena galopus ATCC 62051]
MSAPPSRTQKPLLLPGIAPHLFQTRASHHSRQREKMIALKDSPVPKLLAAIQELVSGQREIQAAIQELASGQRVMQATIQELASGQQAMRAAIQDLVTGQQAMQTVSSGPATPAARGGSRHSIVQKIKDVVDSVLETLGLVSLNGTFIYYD